MDVYVVGECPICGPMGDMVVVKDPSSGTLFLFCHHCGCAWPDPPPMDKAIIIAEPDRFSPGGFVLPLDEDIARVRTGGWPVEKLEEFNEEWAGRLKPHLLRP